MCRLQAFRSSGSNYAPFDPIHHLPWQCFAGRVRVLADRARRRRSHRPRRRPAASQAARAGRRQHCRQESGPLHRRIRDADRGRRIQSLQDLILGRSGQDQVDRPGSPGAGAEPAEAGRSERLRHRHRPVDQVRSARRVEGTSRATRSTCRPMCRRNTRASRWCSRPR